jgi:DNA-binding HxlR family transcriptional regulator
MSDAWPSSRRTLQLLGGRWTLEVLAQLGDGGRRYHDLHDAIGSISHKVLTETLRRAERNGFIFRQLDSVRVDTATLYQLTDLGRALDEPLEALGRWSDTNWPSLRRHTEIGTGEPQRRKC